MVSYAKTLLPVLFVLGLGILLLAPALAQLPPIALPPPPPPPASGYPELPDTIRITLGALAGAEALIAQEQIELQRELHLRHREDNHALVRHGMSVVGLYLAIKKAVTELLDYELYYCPAGQYPQSLAIVLPDESGTLCALMFVSLVDTGGHAILSIYAKYCDAARQTLTQRDRCIQIPKIIRFIFP